MSRPAFDELKQAFQRKAPQARALAVDHIADLFVAGAADFSDQHVALFDQVIGLLTDAIESRARARLAEKIADIPNAPPELIRKLACDEITVARPVLTRSPRLVDEDLIRSARKGGRDHMLAISERRSLSKAVTDVLISEGDRLVVNALAGNPGADFSDESYAVLVSKSATDELLQSTLGRRTDIPQKHMAALFDLAKKAARERLLGELEGASRHAINQAISSSAREVAAETAARAEATRLAIQEVALAIQANVLTEEMLLDYARRHQVEKAIAALAYLAKLPHSLVERGMAAGDHDFTLIVARSVDLSWATVKALLTMRATHRPGESEIADFADSYTKLSQPTAQRILQFMHARESTGRR